MDSDELARIIHDHHNSYITNVDSRASILITGQLAFLGLFANAIGPAFRSDLNVLVLLGLTVFFGLIAILFAGYVIYPKPIKPEESYIFWENILGSWNGPQAYSEDLLNLNPDEASGVLCEDIYQLSFIAHNRFKYLRYSLICTFLMLLASLGALGLIFIGNS